MENKNGRMQTRVRQRRKLSRRTIIILAASCMTCLVIGLAVFFNISHVDHTMAKQSEAVKVFSIEEQAYINDMSIAAPVIADRPAIDQHTQLTRKVKEMKQESNNLSK